MTRMNAREIVVQILFGSDVVSVPVKEFAEEFLNSDRFELLKGENEIYNDLPDEKSLKYINRVIEKYSVNKDVIDDFISKNSKGWKLSRISSTALAVMRTAVCEMLYEDDIPNAVAIDSAIEIAKKYDDEDVVSFVNGVLGAVAKSI